MIGGPAVALFDYGAGNLHSLGKALEAGGARVSVVGKWNEALARDALVLPGVGSFGAAVRSLEGREALVRDALENGIPCLGICLGMQLLFDASEEGPGTGIGFVPGTVRRLRSRIIPQMGWNDVELSGPAPGKPGPDPIFAGMEDLVAYYANSYVCDPANPQETIAFTEYQGDRFTAGIRKNRTWGVQFHPEKSSTPGLTLIANFLQEVGE
ncbi:MAG: imidazole glycerol phosphate synthase subunit HisH [Planctomycetota bacterium]